jgi:hypothetical protein
MEGGGLARAMRRRSGTEEAPATDGPRIVTLDGDWSGDATPAIDLLKSGTAIERPARSTDHVHVSDSIGKCLRKIALIRRMNVRTPSDRIMDGLGLTFAQGDAIHDYIKRRYIVAHPDKVWANWTCKCKHTEIGPCVFAKRGRHTTCPKCGTEVDQHNEVPLHDEEHDLVGNPDLVLWLNDLKAFYLVEIKSMAGGQWKELVRVVPDHLIQVSFYWRLFHVNNMPLVDTTSVLYATKEFSFKLPYKEMTQPQPASQERLTPYLEDLKVLKLAKDPKKPLPPRITCGTLDAPEAKKCHVCVACFQQ